MICNRCQQTGFLNSEQIAADIFEAGTEAILDWLADTADRGDCSCHINPPCNACATTHDVQVCDCCGDGQRHYGEPGQHTQVNGQWDCGHIPECI